MKSLKTALINQVKDRFDEREMALLEKAIDFIEEYHKNQKRLTGESFINHPLRVALFLAQIKLDFNTIIAALLHDIVEDTDINLQKIKSEFNEEIAFLVQSLTKINKLRYQKSNNQSEDSILQQQIDQENFRNMILAMAKDLRVIIIKLVDRLDNMKTLWALPLEKQKRKAQETLDIFAPLAYRLGLTDIGAQLEDLSFPYVYPREYKLTRQIVGKKREQLENYLKSIVPILEKALKEANIKPLEIKYRTKHLYSIWRKLQKEEMDIKRVYDLVAMRLIMRSVSDCYAALGVIHSLWKPVPQRFKDYIALPKPNGYQSLHTTVFAEDGRIVEIQIRTKEMDEEAEWGIASHWFYEQIKNTKTYKKRKNYVPPKRFYWIKQLQEWQKKFYNTNDPQQFLEFLKIDFFKDRIFVLTPKGDVIDLPEGATPIDFAYQVHTEIGNQAIGAKVNGKLVPLDYELKSGEVVEIITKKGKLPSSSWLEFVKMAETKKKIEEALRRNKLF
ncbi:MAG: RelA/SpoT family protein [Minisyncoccia bacterium]